MTMSHNGMHDLHVMAQGKPWKGARFGPLYNSVVWTEWRNKLILNKVFCFGSVPEQNKLIQVWKHPESVHGSTLQKSTGNSRQFQVPFQLFSTYYALVHTS